MGLLNSNLLEFYLKSTSGALSGHYFSYQTKYLSQIPIRIIDFADPTEKAYYEQVVKLVERMIELNEKMAKAKTPIEKTHLERQIKATDNQIDQLVYELYALTDKEIKIVEESLK